MVSKDERHVGTNGFQWVAAATDFHVFWNGFVGCSGSGAGGDGDNGSDGDGDCTTA